MNIVFGDGVLGSALVECLRRRDEYVIATSRCQKRDSGIQPRHRTIYWDAAAKLPDLTGVSISTGYLCFGMTGRSACESSPKQSREVNVTATIRLAEYLMRRGSHVVYPSTTLQVGEYAEQKMEVEERLLRMGAAVSVVRLGKVLHPGHELINQWHESLSSGEAIECFGDVFCAPISLPLALEWLTSKIPGRITITSSPSVSYADIGRYLCRRIGLPESHVVEVSGKHVCRERGLASVGCEEVLQPSPWVAVESALTSRSIVNPQSHR